MFTESKAHTKAIDLELRRIDVQQSNQHVQYLAAYMPDTFMSRGGMCFLSNLTYPVSLANQVV
jgi:dynactin 1